MVFAGIERCTSVSNFNDVADRCKGIRKERGTDTIEELEGHDSPVQRWTPCALFLELYTESVTVTARVNWRSLRRVTV